MISSRISKLIFCVTTLHNKKFQYINTMYFSISEEVYFSTKVRICIAGEQLVL